MFTFSLVLSLSGLILLFHSPPPSTDLHKERKALNSESVDATDRASTSEGFVDHHDDQEAASPIEEASRWLLGVVKQDEDWEDVGGGVVSRNVEEGITDPKEGGVVKPTEGAVYPIEKDETNVFEEGVVSRIIGASKARGETKHMSLSVPAPIW